ncbi:hypothetical protein DFH09DRAFT_1125296 [Mycena vulgaris]|nr:hypothetical protein DFH09DRAFT_1125296 [Mycena vulgaris]
MPWSMSGAAIFPVAAYAAHISTALLPSLAQLTDVHLVLWGDREPWPMGCDSCDEDNRRYAPGPLRVDYRFWVRRMEQGEAELVLTLEEA